MRIVDMTALRAHDPDAAAAVESVRHADDARLTRLYLRLRLESGGVHNYGLIVRTRHAERETQDWLAAIRAGIIGSVPEGESVPNISGLPLPPVKWPSLVRCLPEDEAVAREVIAAPYQPSES